MLRWKSSLKPAAAATTYLIEENFEGDYSVSNPDGWTIEGSPTTDVDFDSTTNVMEGSQCLLIADSDARAVASFAAQSEVWAYCMWKIQWNSAYSDIIRFRDSGGTLLMSMQLSNAGSPNIKINANGTTSNSLNVVAANDEIHIWLHWVSGGTCELFVSDTDTRPTTDSTTDTYLTGTGATADAVDLFIQSPNNRTTSIDKVRVSATEIGSSPD